MDYLESSKQKMVTTVIKEKERIVKATNEIIEKLSELRDLESGKEASLYIRKRVNQIVSDLSIIGGFCGKREKRLVEIINSMVQTILMVEGKVGFAELLKDWCIDVNSIIVDFTKTPFKFVGGELRFSLRNLEAKVKTILKR